MCSTKKDFSLLCKTRCLTLLKQKGLDHGLDREVWIGLDREVWIGLNRRFGSQVCKYGFVNIVSFGSPPAPKMGPPHGVQALTFDIWHLDRRSGSLVGFRGWSRPRILKGSHMAHLHRGMVSNVWTKGLEHAPNCFMDRIRWPPHPNWLKYRF